jgi:hypothetical protein
LAWQRELRSVAERPDLGDAMVAEIIARDDRWQVHARALNRPHRARGVHKPGVIPDHLEWVLPRAVLSARVEGGQGVGADRAG